MGLDYLILYEHPVREYESILLLEAELKRRGYSCEIHQLLGRKKLKYITIKRPKVLISSCMYNSEAVNSHVYNNVGKCAKVVNLHWEQMLSDTQENEEWFNFSGAAKNCIQTCWGEQTRQRLIAHGMKSENCPVTGAIMMDFLRPEFQGYFKTKQQLCEEYGLNKDQKMFLYISSFGYASMSDAEVKELSHMAGVDFTGFAVTNRISMQKTLEWFAKYLQKNPEIQLVYRRHPSEWASDELMKMQKKYANFHVIFDGSVKQWITAADNIFIWMSTAIAEVYFANKSCHILRPVPIEHEYDPVIYKNARYITDYTGFEQWANSENADFPINGDIIEGYFDHNNEPAYIRMADLLENVYKNSPFTNPFDTQGFIPKFNALKYIALWGVHIFHAFRFNPIKLIKLHKGFAEFASRIYGYVAKAYVSKADVNKMRKKIKPYIIEK